MKQKLTNSTVEKLNPSTKTYECHDEILSNLFVRVHPSGKKVYYVYYNRRGHKLGPASVLTAVQARDMAREILYKVAQGLPLTPDDEQEKPAQGTGAPADEMLLREYIDDIYAPWVRQHRRTGQGTLDLINRNFADLMDKKICDIKKFNAIEIQTKLAARGLKRASVNRAFTAIIAVLNWGVKSERLSRNPKHLCCLGEYFSLNKWCYIAALASPAAISFGGAGVGFSTSPIKCSSETPSAEAINFALSIVGDTLQFSYSIIENRDSPVSSTKRC